MVPKYGDNSVIIRSDCFGSKSDLIDVVDLNDVPFENNDMSGAFFMFPYLINVSNINENTTNMAATFFSCDNLVNAPVLPNNLVDMYMTFAGCTNLVNAPAIPNSVVNMCQAFEQCNTITTTPEIPNSVTDLELAFGYCYNLVNTSTIPNSVVSMEATYFQCYNLTSAPDMNNATNVSIMRGTFADCNNITGDIYIGSEIVSNAVNCFAGTSLTKNVYIPFKNGGVYTTTYNSFIAAGYDAEGTRNGVYLKDINGGSGTEIDVSDYEYTLNDKTVTLTKYVGAGGDVVIPNV